MKNTVCTITGVIGTAVAQYFGGWDASLKALLLFMVIDYISGSVIAAFFRKSPKTETGGLSSKVGFIGLCKKGMILCFVLIGTSLDSVIGSSYIRDGVCIAFIANELVSITENAGIMGIPLPRVISNAINILKSKEEKIENKEEK